MGNVFNNLLKPGLRSRDMAEGGRSSAPSINLGAEICSFFEVDTDCFYRPVVKDSQ